MLLADGRRALVNSLDADANRAMCDDAWEGTHRPLPRRRRHQRAPDRLTHAPPHPLHFSLILGALTLIPATNRGGRGQPGLLPAVPVGDLLDRATGRGLEVVAGEVRDRDERDLRDALRDAEQLGRLGRVREVQRGQHRAETAAAQRQLEAPHRGDDRPVGAGRRPVRCAVDLAVDARDHDAPGTSWRTSARYFAESITRCCDSRHLRLAQVGREVRRRRRRGTARRAPSRSSGSVTTIHRQPCELPPGRGLDGEAQALLDRPRARPVGSRSSRRRTDRVVVRTWSTDARSRSGTGFPFAGGAAGYVAPTVPPVVPSRGQTMWWGLTRRCGRCGGGHLFTGYFTMVDDCPTLRAALRARAGLLGGRAGDQHHRDRRSVRDRVRRAAGR